MSGRNDFDWFPLSSDYPEHRKTLHLCELLDNELADAYPTRLMAWLRNQENCDGVFRSVFEVEKVARWKGDTGRLLTALQTAEIFDGLTYVHWRDKGGKLIRKMIASRRRSARNRVREQFADGARTSTRTVRESSVTRERDRVRERLAPTLLSQDLKQKTPVARAREAKDVPTAAAEAYLATFGGRQSVEDLARDFVQLGAADVPADFAVAWLTAKVREVSKLEPWKAAEGIHAAWKSERDRRQAEESNAAEKKRLKAERAQRQAEEKRLADLTPEQLEAERRRSEELTIDAQRRLNAGAQAVKA